jgi:signal transduction histidine kinase
MPATCPGRRRGLLLDLTVALVFTAAVVAITRHIPVDRGQRALDATGYASIVAAGIALGLRRTSALLGLVIVEAAVVTYLVRGYAGGPVYFALCASLFAFTAGRGRTRGLLAASCAMAGLLVAAVASDRDYGFAQLLVVGWALAAVFLGDAARSRADRALALRQRALDHEQARAEETRRLIAEDRLRIARELHDSVAHAMTIINVQAGAAAHVMSKQPERVHDALRAIQHASSDVLDQMNALLRVVRVDTDEDLRSPTPDLAQLELLVTRVGDAGLAVDLSVEGSIDRLPSPVSTAAYRIVQESLTNVLRHAGTTRAKVRVVARGPAALTVTVTDEGAPRAVLAGARPAAVATATPGAAATPPVTAGAASSGPRFGIVGMRERAAATGGALRAEPRPGGGFIVQASWSAP